MKKVTKELSEIATRNAHIVLESGDEKAAQIKYVRWRVEQLKAEEENRLEQLHREHIRASYKPPKHSSHWHAGVIITSVLVLAALAIIVGILVR
ncbi:MAG: hypothetical protein ACKVRP_08810 [Bacteroidota bacterium]